MTTEERRQLKLDRTTDHNLELLAEHEGRTKVGEFRFLLKERAKQLGVKLR
jgi:hypothetical protein